MKSNRGFTLVEVLGAAITMGVLSAMMYSLFLGAWMNFEMELTRTDLAEEAARIFRVIEEDIMESRRVSLVNDGTDLHIDFPLPQLKDPTNPGSDPLFGPNPRGNFPEEWIEYQVSALSPAVSQLERVGETEGSVVLSTRIGPGTGFQIDGSGALDGRRVEVTLELSDQVFRQQVFYRQQKEIIARN